VATDFARLIGALTEGGVLFILVGGAAAASHGALRLTEDVDVVYERSAENLHRLAAALEPLKPYLRDAPTGLPFRLDFRTLSHGLNFPLTTTAGALDLFGEITGGGGYHDLLETTDELVLFGHHCRVLGLRRLIEVKRAAGRPRDFEAIAELESLLHGDRG